MIRYLLIIITTLLFSPVMSQEIQYHHSIYNTFIENKGQWNDQVLFKNRMKLGNMWVEQGRILFQLQDYSNVEKAHFHKGKVKNDLSFRQQLLQLKFVGSQRVNKVIKKGKSSVYYNYFRGNDRSKWASDVHGFEEFTMENLYPGINLHFIEEKQKTIKYEFIVSPHTSANAIKLAYSFPKKMKIDAKGNLIIDTEIGKIMEKKPRAYQIVNGKIKEVSCDFQLNGNKVTFKLGRYNKDVRLVIDPTLVFATYDGALSDNFGMTATYGYDGTAYCGGIVYGNAYPMPDSNVFNSHSNMTTMSVGVATTDAFIAKYSPDGTTMLWSTFFGGGDNTQGTDVPHSLICDRNNNIYVYGTTSSTDFPIVNGFQSTFGGGTPFTVVFNGVNFGTTGCDIYVAKFSSNGHQLLGSTYVGGNQNDGANYIVSGGNYNSYGSYDSLTSNYGDQFRGEIMLDKDDNILVGSCSRSTNFPTVNAFQPTLGGQEDGVIFKVRSDFSGLIFSSFFGGTQEDAIYSVKIDSSENIVFAGGTTSTDLTTSTGCYQSSYNGGTADGFIGKLAPDGLTLNYSTYVGTPNYDQTFFVAIDRLDNIFVLGQSNGGSFPVTNATYSNPNSSQFIAKFRPDLSGIEASTVFGSGSPTFDISPSAFMVDICGNMYVSGWGANLLQSTPMSGMPVTPDAFQGSPPNGFDFYLMVIEHGFNSLLYGTYMGGNQSEEHVDGGTSRFDKNGVVYQCVCCGCGGHSDFPTTPGAWSNVNNSSNCNALVFKFDFNIIPHADFTINQSMGCSPFEVHFNNFSSHSDTYMWHFGNGDLDSTTFEPTKTYTTPGNYTVMLTVTDSVCLLTDTALVNIQVYPTLNIAALPDVYLCDSHTITLSADANGTATSFIWSSDINFSDTLNTSLSDSTATVSDPHDGYYYVEVSNNGCSKIDSVYVHYIGASLTLNGNTKLCKGDQSEITATSDNPSISFSNFDWSSNGIIVSGDGTNTVTVNPDSSQYLYVTATANNGCVVHDSVLVLVSDIPSNLITATASKEKVPIGGNVKLSALPDGYTYLWTPPDGVAHPTAQETDATVKETTTYTVHVSDGICTKEATVLVKAFPYVCDKPYIFVPNAFSPNGDGKNDKLYVRSQVVQKIVFRVYNRWGQKVYETNRTNIGWDGKYNGKLADPDVYDYYMEGECIDGQHFLIKGNVTLIR